MQRISVVALLLLLAVGCGPQPEDRPVPQGPSATVPLGSPAGSGDSPTSRTPADTTTRPHGDETSDPPSRVALDDAGGTLVAIRGLPPGPASPDTPAPFRWYAALQDRQCAGLADTATNSSLPEPERAMYAALAEVCGLLNGERGEVDWDQARAAFRDTAPVTDCLVVAARQLLGDVVAAHDAAPDAVLTPGPAADGTACPVSIDGVEMIGPTQLIVTGPYLFDLTSARVGSVDLLVGFPEVEVSSGVPVVRVTLDADDRFCLPPGEQSALQISGDGYTVAADFVAVDLGQGACDQVGEPTPVDAATPVG